MCDPRQQMLDLIFGASKSYLIYCAAKLNIVEHLSERSMNADELAQLTDTKPELLYRFLRSLTSLGLLVENDERLFSVTELGLTLKPGTENCVKNFAIIHLEPSPIPLTKLEHTLRTGEPAFDYIYGISFFEYLNNNRELRAIFDDTMDEYAKLANTSMLVSGYDYTGFNHIVDIGGGNGKFLIEILEKTPYAKGTVLEIESVIEATKKGIDESNVKDRCTTFVGSFFDVIPPNGDCYILRNCLHDWNDENALKILVNIRKQMKPGTKLLAMEMKIPDGTEPHLYKEIDMHVLAHFAGKKRTKADFENLFAKSSLKLTNLVAFKTCPMSIIEAEPV